MCERMGLERKKKRLKRERSKMGWELENIEGGESGRQLRPLSAPPRVVVGGRVQRSSVKLVLCLRSSGEGLNRYRSKLDNVSL
jgi:hypothetical protein